MSRNLTVDGIRDALPELDELRPLLDLALERSEADPTTAWAGSGQLGTVGGRRVDAAELLERADELADEAARHLRTLYRTVAEALSNLEGGDRTRAARHLLDAAAHEEARDRPDRAEAYASAAHRTVAASADGVTTALALRRWARAEWTQGELEAAAERYGAAHALARDAGDSRGAAEAAIGAGNVLEEQGRWRDAEGWYRRALALLEPEPDPSPELWQALLNLHIVLRSDGRIGESLPWLERAEVIAARLDDASARPFIENARGQLHAGRGETGPAETRLRDALAAARGSRAEITIRLNLAEILLAQDRTLEAAEEARRAERDAVRAARTRSLPEVYRLLGRIASREGNPDAFVFFERSLEIVRERNLPALEEATTLQAYAEAEAARGEDETARELLQRARERFATVGITELRHPWTQTFGSSVSQDAPDDEPTPTDEPDRTQSSHTDIEDETHE